MSIASLVERVTDHGPVLARIREGWGTCPAAKVIRRALATEELAQLCAGVESVLSGEKVTPTHRVWYHAYARQAFPGGWALGSDVLPEEVLIDTWCRRGLSRPVLEMIRNEAFAIMMLEQG